MELTVPLGSDQVGPLAGIDEDVAYSAGDADALSAACRASASLIEGQAGSRSSAVSTAKTHFEGRFSRLFSDNASVQAADATNLVTALRDVATKVDALTEEADESGDDRQGHEHGHCHDSRRGQSHRGQEPDAGHAQTAQGHDDRGAGEDDGPSRGGGGPPSGLGRIDAVGEVLARPRDDE